MLYKEWKLSEQMQGSQGRGACLSRLDNRKDGIYWDREKSRWIQEEFRRQNQKVWVADGILKGGREVLEVTLRFLVDAAGGWWCF